MEQLDPPFPFPHADVLVTDITTGTAANPTIKARRRVTRNSRFSASLAWLPAASAFAFSLLEESRSISFPLFKQTTISLGYALLYRITPFPPHPRTSCINENAHPLKWMGVWLLHRFPESLSVACPQRLLFTYSSAFYPMRPAQPSPDRRATLTPALESYLGC